MAWEIPLFDLDVGDQEMEALRRVLGSRWISMGEATQELERRFANSRIGPSSGPAYLRLLDSL